MGIKLCCSNKECKYYHSDENCKVIPEEFVDGSNLATFFCPACKKPMVPEAKIKEE